MTAGKLDKLVAEAAAKEVAPIPAEMKQIAATRSDGALYLGYLHGAKLLWWDAADAANLPLGAIALYCREI